MRVACSGGRASTQSTTFPFPSLPFSNPSGRSRDFVLTFPVTSSPKCLYCLAHTSQAVWESVLEVQYFSIRIAQSDLDKVLQVRCV